MAKQIEVHVCDVLRFVQQGYAVADRMNDQWVRDICDGVFSALMTRDLRKAFVSIPAEPHQQHITFIRQLIGE